MRFKQYIGEGEGTLSKSGKVLFSYDGYKIHDTHHGYVRLKQRNTLSDYQLIHMFKSAIEKLQKHKIKVGEKIVFWSKTLGQAFIAKVEDAKDLVLVSFYPRHDKPNTGTHPYQREVVIEGEQIRVMEID